MPASIYQHAPVLQIAPAVGAEAHMARCFTADLTALLMKCCCSSGGTCWRREKKRTPARRRSCTTFTRLSLNSQSVFRCSNKAAGRHWHLASAQEPHPHQAPVPPLSSWTSGSLTHPPDSSAERGCLLWCKTASMRRNHNTLYFLPCLLYAGLDAVLYNYSSGVKKTLQRRKAA